VDAQTDDTLLGVSLDGHPKTAQRSAVVRRRIVGETYSPMTRR
jgi:hypothetical protein